MNQRRSSFVVLSVTAHAIVFAALLATSLLAPGLLPVPRTVLALTLERVVQPVDINLPPLARNRGRTQPGNSQNNIRFEDPAPTVVPTGITAEPDRTPDTSGPGDRLTTIEHGGQLVDGIGVTETVALTPPVPPGPVRLHQGIQAPRKTVDVAPRYPSLARESHTQGVVILEVIIDEQGNVTSARVLKSVPLLDRAAVDAVQQWKFTPTLLNHEPIPIVMTVTVSFRLQ